MKILARILGWTWVAFLSLVFLTGILGIFGAIANGESWVGALLMVLISGGLIVAAFVMPRLLREHLDQK